MASFLPIVAQLSEEYEPHAIAAAALQMAYDQTRPTWMRSNNQDHADEPFHGGGGNGGNGGGSAKPKPVKRGRNVGNSENQVSPSLDR